MMFHIRLIPVRTAIRAVASLSLTGVAFGSPLYSNDFDINKTGFTETVDLRVQQANKGTTPTGDWSLQTDGGGQDYQAQSQITTGTTDGWADLSSSLNLAAAAPWTLTTQFEIDDIDFNNSKGNNANLGGSFIRLGLGAAGSVADLNDGSRYALYYDLSQGPGYTGANPALSLYLVEEGGDGNVSAVSTGTLAADTSGATTYTLSLDAVETAGTLTLLGTLTDGVNSISVTDSDATPLAGSHFGLLMQAYADAGSGTNTVGLNVDFDHVVVTAVPEPATLGLIALGVLLTVGRLRID